MISRYPEVIRPSLRHIADPDRRPSDFACPILSQKKQLWDIPGRRECFTSRSAEVSRSKIPHFYLTSCVAQKHLCLSSLVWPPWRHVKTPYKQKVKIEPSLPSARLLGLGSKLYPSNMHHFFKNACVGGYMQRMLNKDLTRFMQSLSRVCQIEKAKERFCWQGGEKWS